MYQFYVVLADLLLTPQQKAQWKRIGILLKIEDNILNYIATTCKSQNVNSYNTLCEVLQSTGITVLKENVSQAIEIISITCALQEFYTDQRDKDIKEYLNSYRPERMTRLSNMLLKQTEISEKEIEDVANLLSRQRLTTSSVKNLLDEYILDHKINKSVPDIFSDNKIKGKVILIEGASGTGKTVLSREIAFHWAKEKILSNKILLFLIHLCDPEILQIKSQDKFISYAINAGSENDKSVKLIVQHLSETFGKFCMIVLDGYDEISEKVEQDSFILKILQRKVFPLCSLVITSQPTASFNLRRNVDQRIEILGFTEKDREEYISSNLNTEEAKFLKEYLKTNSFINELCYIPLNMTMLLNLFKADDSKQELPKTQTGITSKFIYITISRFITRKDKLKIPATIKSPNDLWEPYVQQFRMLCKVAFELLESEKIVFRYSDIQNCFSKENNTAEWNHFGLVKETTYFSFPGRGVKTSFSFLHLSMQECLAAHYIAFSPIDKQRQFLRQNFWKSKYLNTGVMYVGLTKGKSAAFKNLICGYTGIFHRLLGSDRPTIHDKLKKLHCFNCLLEAENEELFAQLQFYELSHRIIDLSDYVLQQKDICALGFFLSRSTTKTWNQLDLSNCFITEDCVNKFPSLISNTKVSNVSIDIINLTDTKLSQSVDALINLTNCFGVNKLIIGDIVAEDLEFKKALVSSITKVKEVAMCSKGCTFLINYTFNNKGQNLLNQFHSVYVWNSIINFGLINYLAAKFHTINVYIENLTDDKICDIAFDLQSIRNTTVTYVLQSTNKIFAYGAEMYQISQGFKSDSFSKKLSKTVYLRQCKVEDKDIVELRPALKFFHFDKLDVSQCSLTIPAQFEILKCCTVKHLTVSGDTVCNEEMCNLVLTEVNKESKIVNFKEKTPLMLSTGETNTLFYVNCSFTDTVIKDYNCVNSHLVFSNIALDDDNIELFLMHCTNSKLQIDLFQMNITNEILSKILSEFEHLQHKAYVLASNTEVIAYNAKQQQITEAIVSCSAIVTLQLINCEIDLTKLETLGNLFSNSSRNWELIDLSGCNIKHEGCLILYECFSANKNKVHIKVLNLSFNCLTIDSVIAILKVCENHIVKALIISRNDIPVGRFNDDLYRHVSAGKPFLNFAKSIPLLVYENEGDQPSHKICNVYASDMEVFQSQTYEDEILYNFYHVHNDQKFNKIYSILLSNSTIKIDLLKVENAMIKRIFNKIAELIKLNYSKFRFSEVDFSHELGHSFEKISSEEFSSSCAHVIVESLLQQCVIEKLVLPNNSSEALERINESILREGKKICNFVKRIPLLVYGSEGDQPSHKICNVYASDMGVFQSQTYEDEILYNFYHVHYDQTFNKICSILLSNSTIKIDLLKVENAMIKRIFNKIAELIKLNYSKFRFSEVDFSHELDHSYEKISSKEFLLSCVPMIIESLQQCAIEKFVLPNNSLELPNNSLEALERINESILREGKTICNSIEKIPLTIYIKQEFEDEEGKYDNIIANTYVFGNASSKDLIEIHKSLEFIHEIHLHTYILIDCLKTTDLNSILLSLNAKPNCKINVQSYIS